MNQNYYIQFDKAQGRHIKFTTDEKAIRYVKRLHMSLKLLKEEYPGKFKQIYKQNRKI
jgi:hypothetical protein